MRTRRLPHLLLALALLLTQWLSFAHALEHPALSAEKACSICALGINIDGGAPLPASPAVAHWQPSEAPRSSIDTRVVSAIPPETRARAPPQTLA
ncbi:hypothetical protein [Hydrocarboniphaga sp.]|uniref:hypothetical protein n=1 Tax=Hydrocarboniphaga sp. TaxID=2033016 RepID=UPI003D0CAB3F